MTEEESFIISCQKKFDKRPHSGDKKSDIILSSEKENKKGSSQKWRAAFCYAL